MSKARTQTNPALRKLSDVEGRLQRLEQVIELERARNTQMASRLRAVEQLSEKMAVRLMSGKIAPSDLAAELGTLRKLSRRG